MEMTDLQIEALMGKLKKRGFITDGTHEHCPGCGKSAVWIYKLAGRIGGRDIRWCLACGSMRSWRRNAQDDLVEEKPFDIETFLK